MLYLSVILIMLGALIFVYSIILDANKRTRGRNSAEVNVDKTAPAARHASSASPKVEARQKEEASAFNKRPIHRGTGPFTGAGKNRPDETGAGIQQAVLYEDGSGVIDFNNGAGPIISNIEEYKNIKRIGSGSLTVEKGGLSFSMGKKLYRYDFHRVRDIKTGENHLALFLNGSDAVKLFIFDDGEDRIEAIDSIFRDYMRGAAQNVR
jgi:hypothetical protein